MTIARSVRRALETADIEPRNVPPSALLFVRRMEDPLPRCLLDNGTNRAATAWQYAFRAALEELATRAFRPVATTLRTDNAPAVLFSDRSEMLACLLEDLVAGCAWSRWWWQRVLPPSTLSTADQVAFLIAKELRALPGAARILDARRTLEPIARVIAPAAGARLLELFIREFELPLLIGSRSSPPEAVAPPTHIEAPPWAALLPEICTLTNLTGEIQVLLALSLLAGASHPAIRSAAFLTQISNWLVKPAAGPPSQTETAGRPAAALPVTHDSDGQIEPESLAVREEAAIHTDYAGAFYLTNVVKSLDLPRSSGASISGWTVFELIARTLLSIRDADDPLWDLSAELDGRREGQLPGWDFEDPGPWMIHPRFVPQTGSLGVHCSAGGTQFWHPQGFPVHAASGPLTTELRAATLAKYGATRLERARRWTQPRPGGHPRARAFTSFLTPYVYWRLRASLKLRSDEELAPFLRVRGEVRVTRTHVDVTLPIDAVSLPVRLAGLDANPGWMPSLGRVISFHFA